MSSKQLDTTNIVNELKGSSLFFQEDDNARPKEPAKDARRASVVPPPAPTESKTILHPSLPLPPSEEPLPSPPSRSNPVSLPASDHPSTHNSGAMPTLPGVSQSQGHGEGTMVGSDERRTVRSNERSKVRHSFDILSDQLLALRELAVDRERMFGKKILLGDLVQEALDTFISKERNHD